MSWQKVKLGQFLKNREGRYKPNDKAIQGLKRIDKINFSGTIFLSDKPSNTDMILVKKGDLVISGINVEKGAMNIYHGEEDVVATIHYSSYEFDEEKIDIDFLTNFLKSLEFKKALKEQVPGGIKTEIKPKHILPLIVEIPTDIEEQKRIVKKLIENNLIIEDVNSELTHQLDLIKQLRQAFLREAMQGKLVKSTNTKETGQQLLDKIKAEKAQLIAEKKLKKDKELAPINDDEIPFEIPDHWAWCRLGEIINISSGDGLTASQMDKNGTIPVYGGNGINGYHNKYTIEKQTIVIGRVGYYCGCVHLTSEFAWVTDNAFIVRYSESNLSRDFLIQLLKWADLGKQQFAGSQPVISGQRVYPKLIPLPPQHDQEQIVAKLEELMAFCDGLEQSIKESQGYNEKLLQQVLREALQGNSVINE